MRGDEVITELRLVILRMSACPFRPTIGPRPGPLYGSAQVRLGSGTSGSNPLCSSRESGANLTSGMHPAQPRGPALTNPVLGAARSRMMSEILGLPDPWPPLE